CVPRREGLFVAGFAAETQDLETRARAKLKHKKLDLIVANDVSAPDAGFDVETNRVTLLDVGAAASLPLLSKDEVADRILDRIRVLHRRG
ncbi:MAG: phosphopantothenoylcysteine decarboxylase, partial [bacterium]